MNTFHEMGRLRASLQESYHPDALQESCRKIDQRFGPLSPSATISAKLDVSAALVALLTREARDTCVSRHAQNLGRCMINNVQCTDYLSSSIDRTIFFSQGSSEPPTLGRIKAIFQNSRRIPGSGDLPIINEVFLAIYAHNCSPPQEDPFSANEDFETSIYSEVEDSPHHLCKKPLPGMRVGLPSVRSFIS